MRARILLVAAILVAMAVPTEAQWNVERRSGNAVAMTTGIDGQLHVGVSCQGSNQVVELALPGNATFANGDVEAQWDDGSTERYTFRDQNETSAGVVHLAAGERPHCEAPPAQLRTAPGEHWT